jgi:RHS repeat-associated protein
MAEWALHRGLGKRWYGHDNTTQQWFAASDERGKVIWTASYSAWGRARVQSVSAANDATFNLDLRLPGQWEDRATHLHYNYQRDYNPHTGRYLTPDPLGFPDGPDAYLYVGGDPVNRVDRGTKGVSLS